MNRPVIEKLFTADIADVDPAVGSAITSGLGRQRDEIELIAFENIVSLAILQAQGSVLTNKYAEGFPGHRYHGIMRDAIFVRGLPIHAWHGNLGHEVRFGQHFVVDLELSGDLSGASMGDKLADACGG